MHLIGGCKTEITELRRTDRLGPRLLCPARSDKIERNLDSYAAGPFTRSTTPRHRDSTCQSRASRTRRFLYTVLRVGMFFCTHKCHVAHDAVRACRALLWWCPHRARAKLASCTADSDCCTRGALLRTLKRSRNETAERGSIVGIGGFFLAAGHTRFSRKLWPEGRKCAKITDVPQQP